MPRWPLTRGRLLRHLDAPSIEDAIRTAERLTSAEIRVTVAGFFRGEPRLLAERAFQRLGMTGTQRRNAVLILLAPTRRQVVVLADVAVQGRVAEEFWSAVTEALTARFRRLDFNPGLVDAITTIGAELARHFPPDSSPDLPGDVDELPNTIDVLPRGRL